MGIDWTLLCFAQRKTSYAWFHLLANLLTERKIRFRLGRERGGLIHLKCGVDMGNGLSPWLLCLALDPLMFQLAHKVSAASSAYMDDVTVPWANVQQLALAQSIITQFGRISGLTVAPHHCFRAACWETSRWFRFRLRVRSATGPALHAAARILSPKAGVVRSFPIRARKDLRKVLRAMVALPLPPCKCATKQTALLHRHPKPGEQEDIHRTPWGPANVHPFAKLLGYSIASMYQAVGMGRPERLG